MNVNRTANHFTLSRNWLALRHRPLRMAVAVLALFGCADLLQVIAATDQPPDLPTELSAAMDPAPPKIKTVSVRPAPKDGLITWTDHRLDPPEPPLDLMIFESQPVSMSLSDNLHGLDVDANFLSGARVFSIVRPSAPNDTEAISEHRHATMDSIGQSSVGPFSESRSESTRIFEFTAVSGNVEPIDPTILQLPQVFQVAEVRVVPAASSAGANRTNTTARSTVRRRTRFVATRSQAPATPANPSDPMAALGFTPLAQLSVDTALQTNPEVSPDLQEPDSDAGQLFGSFGQHHDIPVLSHIGLNPDFFLEPADFCHQPLYFEEINLERFGTTPTPRLQPVVSGARFFVTVPAMPYLMTVYRPRVCYQDMSPYRPGRPAPWHRELPPLQLNAATVEAALIAGMFFVIP